MAADHRLALHATLPDRYARHEVLASTVDHRGRLVALVADPSPVLHFSRLRPPPRYATAVICEGTEIREIALADLDLWFTHIDTLGDGIVLATARCEPVGIDRERYGEPVPEDELHLSDNVPLIELDADGVRSVVPNPVTGCTGLAVSGAELAFLDQHRAGGGFHWEIRKARRQSGAITETGRRHLLLPDGRHPTGWARGKIGRDGTLWLHQDGDPRRWYRYEVDT
ncbi:hypothetical protein [Nonomuraea zeae]|uniref:Uncharacterized protein n=1 Tax=Nonomuraea zeae TaxID=1642303 RepID=A0A5S4GU73_9ACTN|nr:hypothetical protein [Nonomuraea zeae]TMR36495.1 hypothetical protein ETD85_10950 [Nonomuraea zeae]